METIAGYFSAIARGLRGLFDLASMAVGVAPTPAVSADFPLGTAAEVDGESALPAWAFQPAETYEYGEAFKRDIGLSMD